MNRYSRKNAERPQYTQKYICIKWKTPTQEITGLVTFAYVLVNERNNIPQELCLAVPNKAWGSQVKRACKQAHLRAYTCYRPAKMSADARIALAKLRLLADPGDTKIYKELQASGIHENELKKLIENYADTTGFTLIRTTGLHKIEQLQYILFQTTGSENASQLLDLIDTQIKHATLPQDAPAIPILLYSQVTHPFKHIMMIGCVDGLIPGPNAYDGDGKPIEAYYDTYRKAFNAACQQESEHTIISVFSKIDLQTAEQAHIRFVRSKVEHGKKLALCMPTPFLQEAGSIRPSTIGGQTFLNDQNLN